MAADLNCVIRTIRTTFKDIDFQNRFAFEDEVQSALHLLVEKHRVGTGSRYKRFFAPKSRHETYWWRKYSIG